jgi:hypothetical protein
MLNIILIASGNICKPFQRPIFTSTAYADKANPNEDLLDIEVDKYASLQTLEIEKISLGVITYKLTSNVKEDEMDMTSTEESPYFEHKLIPKNGGCELKYMTIESNMLREKRLEFKPCSQDCQKKLETALKENKACTYDDTNLKFSIPISPDEAETTPTKLDKNIGIANPIRGENLSKSTSEKAAKQRALYATRSRKAKYQPMYEALDDFETKIEPNINKDSLKTLYDTESKTFELDDNDEITLNSFDIELRPELAITLNNKRFTSNGSCFALLGMIQSLLIKDLQPQKAFEYDSLQIIGEGGKRERLSKNNITDNGEIIITSPNDIQVKFTPASNNMTGSTILDSTKKFILATYGERNDKIEIVERNFHLLLRLVYESKLSTSYYIYVNFENEQNLNNVKELFQSYSSCSDINSLYYYKQINLHNNAIIGNGKLTFDYLKGIVVEYNKDKKLPQVIHIYDITLKTENGKEWLYIKGADVTYEQNHDDKNIKTLREKKPSRKQHSKAKQPAFSIINRKYLVNISDNKFCNNIFFNVIQKYVNEELERLASGEVLFLGFRRL